nr:hypothetical protein [Tanacetum cinerariifolium]
MSSLDPAKLPTTHLWPPTDSHLTTIIFPSPSPPDPPSPRIITTIRTLIVTIMATAQPSPYSLPPQPLRNHYHQHATPTTMTTTSTHYHLHPATNRMVAAAQNINNTTIRYEKKIKFVEQPIGPAPDPETTNPDTIDKYYESVNLELNKNCLKQSKHFTLANRRMNYNMYIMGKMLVELHVMLKLHEKGILKKAETSAVLVIREGKIQKDKKKPQGEKGKEKGKNKIAYALKTKIPPPPKRDNPTKDSIYHHCKEVGHWRRNYLSYHAELKKRKNARLKRSRKLKHEALSLYIGNGMRATVEAIKSFDSILPSGLIIVLDNCHFEPTITRGVVSISRLVKNGYIHTFMNYGIFVSKDNVFYFNAILRDGIYEIDIHNLYPNVSFNYNVSNKRAKHGLDSYYLWHCRLGHINKEHMDMLQRDRLLQPTHDKSHEKYKSCISRKIARNPFPHQVERAKDLLGLIHTDVYGPFRILSRDGAYYFITFTDDFSHYGFVYLMKHKHEVFETFKTLLDMVRSMMNLTTLPKSFWGYALETAARILNMVPTKKVERTPYEIWHEKTPKLSYLRVWGSSGSQGLLEMSESDKGLEIIQEEDTQPSENTSKEHNEVAPIEEYEFGDLDEPSNYTDALADPESDKWLEAMNTEMQSIKDNQVWILVELPPNGQNTRSKWIFKNKTDMDSNVHTFKDRLVAKDYTQTYGVTMMKEVKSCLCKCFSMKDLGEAAYILRIKIIRDRSKQLDALSQSAYIDKFLKKFRMENSKKGYIPMMENPDYRKSRGAKTPTEQNPSEIHWTAVKTILKYSRNTKDMVLVYGAKPKGAEKAGYIVAVEALMEAVWMRKFIDGLGGFMPSNKRPMEMLCTIRLH